jgi:hypothetical protein
VDSWTLGIILFEIITKQPIDQTLGSDDKKYRSVAEMLSKNFPHSLIELLDIIKVYNNFYFF